MKLKVEAMNDHQKYEMAIRFVWGLVGVILGLLVGFLIGSEAYFWIALIVIAGVLAGGVLLRIRKSYPWAQQKADEAQKA